MNNKNLIIGAVIVLGVMILVGGYLLRHRIRAMLSGTPAAQVEQQQNTPEEKSGGGTPMAAPGTSQVQPGVMEVDYDGSTFSPATITVKVGTTVMFVDKSGSGMWVASSPHPTHTDLPGFDQLGQGTSYSYTFAKVGTWGYHNHFNTSVRGTVIVTQ